MGRRWACNYRTGVLGCNFCICPVAVGVDVQRRLLTPLNDRDGPGGAAYGIRDDRLIAPHAGVNRQSQR